MLIYFFFSFSAFLIGVNLLESNVDLARWCSKINFKSNFGHLTAANVRVILLICACIDSSPFSEKRPIDRHLIANSGIWNTKMWNFGVSDDLGKFLGNQIPKYQQRWHRFSISSSVRNLAIEIRLWILLNVLKRYSNLSFWTASQSKTLNNLL